MPSAHAHPTIENSFSDQVAIRRLPAAYRLKYLFASISTPRLRTKQHVVPDYEGCGWCDSTERQILDDIAISQAGRALI